MFFLSSYKLIKQILAFVPVHSRWFIPVRYLPIPSTSGLILFCPPIINYITISSNPLTEVNHFFFQGSHRSYPVALRTGRISSGTGRTTKMLGGRAELAWDDKNGEYLTDRSHGSYHSPSIHYVALYITEIIMLMLIIHILYLYKLYMTSCQKTDRSFVLVVNYYIVWTKWFFLFAMRRHATNFTTSARQR